MKRIRDEIQVAIVMVAVVVCRLATKTDNRGITYKVVMFR